MAQETQYCSLRYILGTVYSWKTEASEISPVGGSEKLACLVPGRRKAARAAAVCRGDRRDLELESEAVCVQGMSGCSRTNSSRLNHVADGEALDGLVLGRASRAVGAADGLDVAATLLVATATERVLSVLLIAMQSNDEDDRLLGLSLLRHGD